MNNGLFGAVRVLEYMSIDQSFLLGVSVLSYVVWWMLWDLLLCEEPAVRSLTFAPSFHLLFLPLWHKHMTTESDYIGSCVSGISNSSPQLFPSLYRGVSSCWCPEVKAMIVMLCYVCVRPITSNSLIEYVTSKLCSAVPKHYYGTRFKSQAIFKSSKGFHY